MTVTELDSSLTSICQIFGEPVRIWLFLPTSIFDFPNETIFFSQHFSYLVFPAPNLFPLLLLLGCKSGDESNGQLNGGNCSEVKKIYDDTIGGSQLHSWFLTEELCFVSGVEQPGGENHADQQMELQEGKKGGGGPGALTAEVQHLEGLGNSDIFGNIW